MTYKRNEQIAKSTSSFSLQKWAKDEVERNHFTLLFCYLLRPASHSLGFLPSCPQVPKVGTYSRAVN